MRAASVTWVLQRTLRPSALRLTMQESIQVEISFLRFVAIESKDSIEPTANRLEPKEPQLKVPDVQRRAPVSWTDEVREHEAPENRPKERGRDDVAM